MGFTIGNEAKYTGIPKKHILIKSVLWLLTSMGKGIDIRCTWKWLYSYLIHESWSFCIYLSKTTILQWKWSEFNRPKVDGRNEIVVMLWGAVYIMHTVKQVVIWVYYEHNEIDQVRCLFLIIFHSSWCHRSKCPIRT